MASLIQTVQQNLGIRPIRKIDPNTQDVKTTDKDQVAEKHTLDQAALPAVLAGIYKYTRSGEGTTTILNDESSDWLHQFFGDTTDDVVAHVADYAGSTKEAAYQQMENIAAEAVKVVRDNAKGKEPHEGLQDYLQRQRREILTYLPAELHLGDDLGENTLDDRTNKMEGPLSNFMQKLANLFNSTEKVPESKSHF